MVVFFGVANDCLKDHMQEFAKVASFQRHRVRAGLLGTFGHSGRSDFMAR